MFLHNSTHLAAVLQQPLDTFVGSGRCRAVQRSPEAVVLLVDGGPVLQQDLQRVGHLVGGGQVEGGVVVLVLVIDGSLVHLQQVFHHVSGTGGCRHVERSLLVLILVVDVSPVVYQDLHSLQETILAGNVERSVVLG